MKTSIENFVTLINNQNVTLDECELFVYEDPHVMVMSITQLLATQAKINLDELYPYEVDQIDEISKQIITRK